MQTDILPAMVSKIQYSQSLKHKMP